MITDHDNDRRDGNSSSNKPSFNNDNGQEGGEPKKKRPRVGDVSRSINRDSSANADYNQRRPAGGESRSYNNDNNNSSYAPRSYQPNRSNDQGRSDYRDNRGSADNGGYNRGGYNSGNDNRNASGYNSGNDNRNAGGYNRGNDNRSAGGYNSGNDNRSAGGYNRGSSNDNRGAGGYDRGSNNDNRGTGGYNRSSNNDNRGAGGYDRGSSNDNRGTGGYNRSSNNDNRGAGGYNRAGGDNRGGGYNNRPAGNNRGYGQPQGQGQPQRSAPPRRTNNNADGGGATGSKQLVKPVKYRENVDPDTPIRLNKYLANAGVCSRREADAYITSGVIRVNGEVVTELGSKVKRGDNISFNEQSVRLESKVYVLLNKPKNTVTTSDDPQNRKTVMDLVKGACPERIYPVGRLDRNTTGVLLLTNDGDLASKLMHPKYVKKKIYQVKLDREVAIEDMQTIADGVTLDDGEIHADSIAYVGEDILDEVGIEIHSGRNRIVRRMFEKLGYQVMKLDRVYFAGLTKKNLPRGRWRYLTETEVNMLRMGAFE